MAAINVVRFRVKPGREKEFIDAHRNMEAAFPGIRRAWLVKTGDRSFCVVGLWRDQEALVAARPAMIANLDKFRDCLEDLGGGIGVTDPVSGEAVVELGGGGGKKEKAGKERRERREGGGGRPVERRGEGAGRPGERGEKQAASQAAEQRRAERRAQRIKERGGAQKGAGKRPER